MMNNRMKSFGLVLAGAVSASVLWHVFDPATAATKADYYKQLNLFGDVFDRVRADYVEQPDEAKMVEAAINGMPAYTMAIDRPGEANCQGGDDTWWIIGLDGETIREL